MENIKGKVALYCRVSTAEQTNLNQEIRLIEYAKQHKLEYDLFHEVESSRKTRPVKNDLLHRLRAKEYSAIIVYRLDRYARSSVELLMEVQELVDKGIGFISISDNLDFTTASGQLHFQILSAFSNFERALIVQRTKEGLMRAKAQGKTLGRPKGSKDSKSRRRSGYILREALKRKTNDQKIGKFNDLSTYIDNQEKKQ